MEKSERPINRVMCEVETCEFNLDGNHCIADSIEVTPRDAMDSQETDCATFLPKMQM